MTLRDRCKEWCHEYIAWAHYKDTADHLAAFVEQEIARCPNCDGKGKRSHRTATADTVEFICPACSGTGKRQE